MGYSLPPTPSLEADAHRLPGKACASYMRSQEMPTINQVQKASELMQEQEWHLNSDGTTYAAKETFLD